MSTGWDGEVSSVRQGLAAQRRTVCGRMIDVDAVLRGRWTGDIRLTAEVDEAAAHLFLSVVSHVGY